MNTFNASSLSREGFPNKFKAYLISSCNEASKIACVAGAWKLSGRKRERARSRETRAPVWLVPTTSKLGLTYKMLNKWGILGPSRGVARFV